MRVGTTGTGLGKERATGPRSLQAVLPWGMPRRRHPGSARHRSSPGQTPFHEYGRDHFRIQRHATAALGGQLVFGEKVSNPTEGEQALVDALETHAAEAHPSGAAFVLRKADLIGREGH